MANIYLSYSTKTFKGSLLQVPQLVKFSSSTITGLCFRFTIHGQKLAEEITCHNSNYPTSASENTNNGIYLTNLPNELLEHIILYLGKCGYLHSKIWHTQNSANELQY